MESIQRGKVDGEELAQPVSPTAQYFNSSVLNVTTIAVLESEIPIDDFDTVISSIAELFLPINPRFSSIMVSDSRGKKHWKSVTVKLKDHVTFPSFPTDLSIEDYDKYFDDYLSKMAMVELPQQQPLWEIHIFNYPTSNAAATLIFKLHHALGDGFSLMGALLSCCKRVDDASIPITFPSLKSKAQHSKRSSVRKTTARFLSMLRNTAADFVWSVVKSTIKPDDKSPIRSGYEGMEFQPVVFSTITFCLDDIKRIKAKVHGTVNDVVTGVIFYGTRLYMQKTSKIPCNTSSTAVILLNTRAVSKYQTVKEVTHGVSSQWGNKFACMYVSIPNTTDAETENPLKFINKTKETIRKKRNSLAFNFTASLLQIISKLKGPEMAAKYIHGTIRNASMGISNLIGPDEQISLANYPCKGMYFMTAGVPHCVRIAILSYMGDLRMSVGTENEFINHQLFISCLKLAFDRIYDASFTREREICEWSLG